MNRKRSTPSIITSMFILLLTTFSVPLPAAESIRNIQVTLGDYQYMPEKITVTAGEKVNLVFTNVDAITPHNFILKHKNYGMDVELDIGAGESKTVAITPNEPGQYVFYCDKQLLFFDSHRERGMEGMIVVTPATNVE